MTRRDMSNSGFPGGACADNRSAPVSHVKGDRESNYRPPAFAPNITLVCGKLRAYGRGTRARKRTWTATTNSIILMTKSYATGSGASIRQ
jgi:hypothetical protein